MSLDRKRRALMASGRLSLSGLMRNASRRRCTHCNAPIIAGLDDDVCASEAYVDPIPVDVQGELFALLDGLSTYDITWRATRLELDWRDTWQITAYPPGTRERVDVVVQHRCGRTQRHTLPTNVFRPKQATRKYIDPPY